MLLVSWHTKAHNDIIQLGINIILSNMIQGNDKGGLRSWQGWGVTKVLFINPPATGGFDWNFREILFKLILMISGWGLQCNWLGAIRQQAIIRAKVDPNLCHHMVSLGHHELISLLWILLSLHEKFKFDRCRCSWLQWHLSSSVSDDSEKLAKWWNGENSLSNPHLNLNLNLQKSPDVWPSWAC